MGWYKANFVDPSLLSLKVKTEITTPTPVASFSTDLADNLVSLKASILASGGNGTPSTPIAINGYSAVNLLRCGKNFVSGKIENANIESTGTISTISNFNCFYCRVVAGATYTITTSDVNLVYAFYNTLPDIGEVSYDGSRTVVALTNNTVTAPITGYMVFRSNDTSFTQAQVELGSTATAYAPYNGQTFTVQFGQTVYGGEYDANRGKVRITHGIVDLSTLTQTSVSSGRAWRCRIEGAKLITSAATVPNILGEQYSPVSANSYNFVTGTVYQNINLDHFEFCNNDSVNPATGKVVYELATPIEIDVSELSVETIVGTNNVFCDTGDIDYLAYRETLASRLQN